MIMACEQFDPNCPGCRPAMLDVMTGQVMDDDHPVMVVVNAIWDASPRDVQEAFWRVTVKNSRDPDDMKKAQAISQRIQEGLLELEGTGSKTDLPN